MGRNVNKTPASELFFKIKDYLSYIVMNFIFFLSKIIPMWLLSNICGVFVAIFGVIIDHSRIALNNFKLVFPDMSNYQRYKLLIECLYSLGKFGGEFFYVYSMKKENLFKIVSLEDVESKNILNEVKNNKIGSLIFSGHFANWELALRYLGESGMKLNVVYRKSNNKLIEEKFIKNTRENCGIKMIAKGSVSAINIIKALKNGENVLILTDQRYKNGINSKLLGIDAYTTDSIAIIAKRLKCPIYSMVAIRNKFKSEIKINARKFNYSVEESNEGIVQRMNDVIGDWICDNPNQWLFLHNRWKK